MTPTGDARPEEQPPQLAAGSAAAFAEAMTNGVLKQAGKEARRPEKRQLQHQGLIPVYMNMDSAEVVRESLLWRHKAPKATPANASVKYAMEHPALDTSEKHLKQVQSNIDAALRPFQGWQDLGGDKLVEIRLYVPREGRVLRDILLWDLNSPVSTPENYAAMTCQDLGLDGGWFDDISAALHRRLEQLRQDMRDHPQDVALVPAPKKVRRETPPTYTPPRPTPPPTEAGPAAAAAAADGSSNGAAAGAEPTPLLLPCLTPLDGQDDWEAQWQQQRAALTSRWAAEAAAKAPPAAAVVPPATKAAPPPAGAVSVGQ